MSDLPLVPENYDPTEEEPVAELAPVGSHAKTAPRLSVWQQLQVGCWIVEGLNNDAVLAKMDEHAFPRITIHTLNYYRYRNPKLIEESKAFLRKSVLMTYASDKAVRIKLLQDHARRLEALMEETGLMEEHTKVLGFGKSFNSVTETRFAQGLSKEYRETLKQIQGEVDPILSSLTVNQKTEINVFEGLSAEDIDQFKAAIAWRPIALPMPEVVDGEAVEIVD